ncbi:DUF4167 domain-containing protein [Roseobacter sp. HKCCA0434]|uniref:DUF4167 domain-containing protein n=1 Tax=Roseobacter sp. HKCCA0434 TaxID=3079297 RepID=UPI002905E567|nr:DUF4167 domain-containing protein [Roseobacter sp. HKCCA0434]
MRQANKNRSRNKNRNNNNKNMGNVTNRVFDSAGPEGKVRGTPSQIVEKYETLARDAHLSGDRVNAENFQQHSEHYKRILAEAQRQQDEQNAKREAEQAQQRAREQEKAEQRAREQQQANDAQPEEPRSESDSTLVETPEQQEAPKPRRTRSRKNSRNADEGQDDQSAEAQQASEDSAA